MIDSAVDYYLTENDSVNKNVLRMKGFQVDIREPVMIHRNGIPLQSGFDMTYFYVVRSDSVFVDGFRLEGSESAPVYLIVTSPLERITLDPQQITGRVTILKGMIDRTDSLIDFYTKELEISKRKADSVYQKLPKNRTLKSKEWKAWDTVMTIHNANVFFFQLYTTFKRYKKSPSLKAEFPEYFISELFNRRTLKYSVVSMPEALPKIKFTEEEMAYQSAGKKNKDKYDRPLKKRHLKREKKNNLWDANWEEKEEKDNGKLPPASDENQPPPEGEENTPPVPKEK